MSFESLLEQAQGQVSDSVLNDRYDGVKRLDTLGMAIPPAVGVLEVSVPWTRLVVDAMSEALTVSGFECAAEGTDELLSRVWSAWKRANMTAQSGFAHTEALIQGESFVLVGRNQGNTGNVTTVRARDGVAIEQSDGVVSAAVITYQAATEGGGTVEQATYYTPNATEVFQSVNGRWGQISRQRGCGYVPVIPLVNASRVSETHGRSEIAPISTFADGASRAFTLLQLATELLSMPQRWIAGGQFEKMRRPDGSLPELDQLYLASYMFAPTSDAKMGQFQGADLSKIIETIKSYAQQVSASTGIPLSMLGFTSEGNPMSAEAMRAAKERFITRAEDKQASFGESWAQWARVNLAFDGVALPLIEDKLSDLLVAWEDVALPSVAARNQAILQAHAQGVIGSRTAREALPLSPEQRARENMAESEHDKIGAAAFEPFNPGSLPEFDAGVVTVGNEDKAAAKGDL